MDRLPSTMNEPAREYFWGITLDKENPTFTWTFEEEEEDTDYLVHTLFLKQAVLGASAVKDERNLVQIETKNFDQKELKQPLLSLTLGKNDMTSLDVSFGHEVAVVFRLVEGSGPVCLSAQQLVEYPDDRNMSQDESELECTEEEEEEEEEEESPKKVEVTKKRKASSQKSGKNKDEAEEDMDEEDEDESMDDEEDEEEMSSPEKSDKKKGKNAKEAKKDDGKAKKGGKMAKVSPKKDANSKKAKKTTKAK
ncbi:mitotic apparatus protein p62-like isoform X2 [Mytilus californianus]|uniref:mitotic apparatus protein p62-like isoform X2 n=1 Tax=Mytilus californianus TaxID=6549 RepID=UPI0022484E8B|nr:mitotic apparatus protein p62-like isoform X2 [Mytilus californianus]